jgi:hypothetical protein
MLLADPAELAVAVVQGEVLVEAAQHHREVLLLLASLPMSVSKQPLAGASQELSATLGAGDPDQGEPPCSILPTDVLEAQKLKRLSSDVTRPIGCQRMGPADHGT